MTVRVMGLDLSITATGIALADSRLLTVGGTAAHGDRRLASIADAIEEAVQDCWPHLVVVEDLPTHAHGAGITGMVHGVTRLTLLRYGIPYALVIPATLKKYATGRGGASKADMRMELYKRAGLDIRDDNQADAWWLRAAGLDQLGAAPLTMPKANRAALAKVAWPTPDLEGSTR